MLRASEQRWAGETGRNWRAADLIEQAQFAGLGLGIGGVHEHAAVQQCAVHIRHHAADIAQALWRATICWPLALCHKPALEGQWICDLCLMRSKQLSQQNNLCMNDGCIDPESQGSQQPQKKINC